MIASDQTSAPRFWLKAKFAQSRNAARADQGSALVEAAVSFVILLTLIFGVMEMCLLIYSYNIITDAAREGTRYAIVHGSTWNTTCSSYKATACTATSAQIVSYVQGVPGLPLSVTVTPKCASAIGGTLTTTLTNCNAQGNVVQINVTYNFPFSVPFVPSHVFSTTSSSEMIISQ